MVEVTSTKYPLNPTLKWTDSEGRLTTEAFRIIRAIGQLIEAITIEDGEIQTAMLQAEIINVSTLFADEVIITSKVAPNAITEITAGVQVTPVGPNGADVLELDVPISSTNNTGVALIFTGVISRPTSDPSNNGYWRLALERNGTQIAISPLIFYDDNFAYPVAVSFIDATPGTDPTYTIVTQLDSGLGNFELSGGVLNNSLFKR